jgi:hypothetical protein
MKRLFALGILLSVFLIFPAGAMAADYLVEADAYFEKGGAENYKMAIDLCLKAVDEDPNSYEANWKCARAHRISAKYTAKGECNMRTWLLN